METGLITKWVLVHNDIEVLAKQFNENQTTASSYTIETFDTESELDARVTTLGLTPLPVETA
jgi:hypothetical protein